MLEVQLLKTQTECEEAHRCKKQAVESAEKAESLSLLLMERAETAEILTISAQNQLQEAKRRVQDAEERAENAEERASFAEERAENAEKNVIVSAEKVRALTLYLESLQTKFEEERHELILQMSDQHWKELLQHRDNVLELETELSATTERAQMAETKVAELEKNLRTLGATTASYWNDLQDQNDEKNKMFRRMNNKIMSKHRANQTLKNLMQDRIRQLAEEADKLRLAEAEAYAHGAEHVFLARALAREAADRHLMMDFD
jgi:hypothetical protein